MNINMFDKVMLKNGETAYIVEILKRYEDYIADINRLDGSVDTDFIKYNQIEKVIK